MLNSSLPRRIVSVSTLGDAEKNVIKEVTKGIISIEGKMNWKTLIESVENTEYEVKELLVRRIEEMYQEFNTLTDDMNLESKIGYFPIYIRLVNIYQSYLPTSILKSKLHYIESKKANNRKSLPWKEYAKRIILDTIDADHYSMLKTNLHNLATLINTKIDS